MIQPLAYVHPSAKISDHVIIDPFVTIHADVEIGEGTHVMSGATIFKGTRIGKSCRIFPGASIGAIPQDLKFDGEETLTVIGNKPCTSCSNLRRPNNICIIIFCFCHFSFLQEFI
jgi:UDP-N-acetylglucosamine acyltransferase